MDPAEITANGLPRAAVGGYKPGPTNELLRRVAWDYRQLAYEHATLSSAVDEFTYRIAELEAQVEELQRTPDDLRPRDAEAERILAEAQNEAEELRRATEAECEALLERATARSRELEQQAQKPTAGEQDIAALEAVRAHVSAELRAALERIIDLGHEGTRTAGSPPTAVTVEPLV